jgi:hypothetical protein
MSSGACAFAMPGLLDLGPSTVNPRPSAIQDRQVVKVELVDVTGREVRFHSVG